MRIGIVALAALVLAACAAPETAPAPEAPSRAWPEAPESARVAFVRAFSAPEDLGIRPSLWSRVVGLVSGRAEEGMVRPMAVAANDAGTVIFVADPGAMCVHRFDLDRETYDCLALGNDQPLASPVGLALAADGRIFVADSGLGAVFVGEPGEDALRQVALSPPPEQPTGIAVHPSGDLFIASTASHSVRRYGVTGRMVREYGGRGDAPGQMNFPTYLWFAAPSELLVTDTMNFRIQRLDADDGVLGMFGQAGDGTGSLARPKGVAMDAAGHIYVIDGMHHAMQVFDREGRLLLAVGEQGQDDGQFWLPAGIFVTAGNLIYVADAYNRRVQVFRYLGGDET